MKPFSRRVRNPIRCAIHRTVQTSWRAKACPGGDIAPRSPFPPIRIAQVHLSYRCSRTRPVFNRRHKLPGRRPRCSRARVRCHPTGRRRLRRRRTAVCMHCVLAARRKPTNAPADSKQPSAGHAVGMYSTTTVTATTLCGIQAGGRHYVRILANSRPNS